VNELVRPSLGSGQNQHFQSVRSCWTQQPDRGEAAAAPCPQVQPVAKQSVCSQEACVHICTQ